MERGLSITRFSMFLLGRTVAVFHVGIGEVMSLTPNKVIPEMGVLGLNLFLEDIDLSPSTGVAVTASSLKTYSVIGRAANLPSDCLSHLIPTSLELPGSYTPWHSTPERELLVSDQAKECSAGHRT